MPRIFLTASLFAVALFGVTLAGLALHPEPPRAQSKPLFEGAQIDKPTLALFQRACQNCHSENTQWPWYSRIPPTSWMIAKDVNDARSHVDFSKWGGYRPEEQETFLTQIGGNARAGRMPPPRYTLLHREAVLAPQERQQIYEWSRAEKKRLRAAGAGPRRPPATRPPRFVTHPTAHPAWRGRSGERGKLAAQKLPGNEMRL